MTILSYVRRHSFVASLIAAAVIVAMIIIGRQANKKEAVTTASAVKKVELIGVEAFRSGSITVSANGVVESKGQADLKSQASAPVAVIRGSIGGAVAAGDVIVELENSDLRAQLAQAKANLSLAEGQYYTGGVSLDSARKNAIDKIRDSYTKSFDAINGQIDPILYDSSGSGWQLSALCQQKRAECRIMETRIDLTGVLSDWKAAVGSVSASSTPEELESIIRKSQANVDRINTFLSYISQALNDASRTQPSAFDSSDLASWKSMVSAASTAISNAGAALTGADSALSSAGATHETTAESQISVARAGVDNLEAQLAKTIIRSPISGKIAALPLKPGELASAGALVATVVGEGGLEIKAYASGEDFSRIKPGTSATVQGGIKGTVTSVAPSVSTTNKKVEVVVAVSEADRSRLVIGQNVQVSIEAADARASALQDKNTTYRLPIQNVKIVPGNAYVFTVDDQAKIKRIPVTLGKVEGDFIEVVDGLSPGLKIVSPVYELEEGQMVRIQQ